MDHLVQDNTSDISPPALVTHPCCCLFRRERRNVSCPMCNAIVDVEVRWHLPNLPGLRRGFPVQLPAEPPGDAAVAQHVEIQ